MEDIFDDVIIGVTPTIGKLLDNSYGTTHGGKLFGVGGVGMDIASRANDGFTIRDGFAVLANIGGGMATGAALGSTNLNPVSVIIGSALGGALAAGFIDTVPGPANYLDLDRRPVTVTFNNPDGTVSVEKPYILGKSFNGAETLQTKRKIYSADGRFLTQEIRRTEVFDGGETLNQFRAFNEAFQKQHGTSLPNSAAINECFPAGTSVRLSDGSATAIENVRVGDSVAAFDGDLFRGRGGLEGKSVVRLFENITDTWIKLSFASGLTSRTGPDMTLDVVSDAGPAHSPSGARTENSLSDNHEHPKELTVTPGHHFLDSKGEFRPIEDILATDGQIVLEDGSVANVTGEYVQYSAETADLFEQAEGYLFEVANDNSDRKCLGSHLVA